MCSRMYTVNKQLCKKSHILNKAALQLPTKQIQRWNPVGWHSESFTLCSYLLAEESWVALCHMAPGYTATHHQTHTHTLTWHTLTFMICSPRALPQVQKSPKQWIRGLSQVLYSYIINRRDESWMSVPGFVMWSKFSCPLCKGTVLKYKYKSSKWR